MRGANPFVHPEEKRTKGTETAQKRTSESPNPPTPPLPAKALDTNIFLSEGNPRHHTQKENRRNEKKRENTRGATTVSEAKCIA